MDRLLLTEKGKSELRQYMEDESSDPYKDYMR
jgi:protein phosphatase 2C family protein 2/3